MTLLVEQGSFTKTTSTSTPVDQTVTLSNGSLTPKVIWLWTGGQTTNDGTYADHSRTCYGFSDTATDVCFSTRVHETSELETNVYRNDSVIAIIDIGTNTIVSQADVSSVGAGNFHLNWSTQSNTSAMVIHYMVAGGTDITNVSVFQTTVGATTTGNKSYNGSGTTFTPDFGMMITGPDGTQAINTVGSSADNSAFSIGAMKSTTARWCIWKRDETVGTSDSDMFHSASLVSFQGSNTTGAQVGAADFVSFNSAAGGGITINVTDGYPQTTAIFMFLLIKGGVWDVGAFQQKSGTGTQDVTLASGQDPELVFLGGINSATTGSVQISSHMGLGGSDGTHSGALFAGSTSDLATYQTATSTLNTKCYRISTPAATASSSTTDAECDMNDMTLGGKFQLNWTTADTTQRQMVYWALGVALTRITSSRVLKWNIVGRIATTRILKWNIVGRIASSRILKWNIVGRIASNRILKWNIVGRIQSSRVLKWNILQRIETSRILKWNILESLTRIETSRILKWNVQQRIASNRILKWNVLQRVATSRVLKWNIIGRIQTNRILKWNVLNLVTTARILKWNVEQRIQTNRILKWNIIQRIASSRVLKWNVLERIQSNRILKWNIQERIASSRIIKWNIEQRIASSRVLKWNILNLVTTARILKWNIIGRVQTSRTLLWDIIEPGLSRIQTSRILKWNIEQRTQSSRILKWDIHQRVTSSRTLKWNILQRVISSRILKWNILELVTTSRVLKWDITERVLSNRILKWNIIGRVRTSRRIKWKVIGISITLVGKFRNWLYRKYEEDDPAKQ